MLPSQPLFPRKVMRKSCNMPRQGAASQDLSTASGFPWTDCEKSWKVFWILGLCTLIGLQKIHKCLFYEHVVYFFYRDRYSYFCFYLKVILDWLGYKLGGREYKQKSDFTAVGVGEVWKIWIRSIKKSYISIIVLLLWLSGFNYMYLFNPL